MSKITTKKTENFVILDKTALNDLELSWQAKGIHSYLLALPNDWQVYLSDLEKRSSDGRDCTKNCLDELVAYGYISRVGIRNEKGHSAGYDYTIYEKPQPEIREAELPKYLLARQAIIERKRMEKERREANKGKAKSGKAEVGNSELGFSTANEDTTNEVLKEVSNERKDIVVSDTPSFPSEESNLSLERKKESNPPSSARPPSLKSGKAENTKAVLAYFDALIKKLDVSYVYPKTAAMWNPIHACCGQIYNEVGAEGLSAFFGKVESMFVSETFPFKDKTSITPVFIGSAKVLGMVANYTPQSNNSPETVQLSVLANSGLKTLKIARKCKAYEIAERLVDKQTGVILNEAISQEDKAYIAWITKNITNHINNNTIDKQEWFCGFVVRKQ